MRKFLRQVVWSSLLAGVLAANSASALPGQWTYSHSGQQNADTYTFTASSTGDIVAYFLGNGNAWFDEQLGLLVDGQQLGGLVFDNQTTPIGETYNFGKVDAGATLTFFINVSDRMTEETYRYFSNRSLNDDGDNHVFSSTYGGSSAIAQGTYVGFEDLSVLHDGFSNYNYADEQFAFTNIATQTVVATAAPEPGAWTLLILGFAGLGVAGFLREGRFGAARKA